MEPWIPAVMGAISGTVVGLAWLVAVVTLLRNRVSKSGSAADGAAGDSGFEPIRSLLEPDDREPSSPLPSASRAPLSLQRYIEVRGAIIGWTASGESIDAQLDAVFGVTREQYCDAHAWWMSALDGADDRLDDLERQVEVFAARYGGSV